VRTSPTSLESDSIPALRAWDIDGLVHGFLGRIGGVSTASYATLNLGYRIGDDERAVDENWRRVQSTISDATLAKIVQVHGNKIHLATRDNLDTAPEADGIVTRERGIVLRVLSADCVPILMIDPEHRVIAAIHAGWRGVIANIADEGVRAMTSLGANPQNIRAAMGPSIGPCCFEVDSELAERFAREIEGASRHSRPGRPAKAYLDLRGIIADQLSASGLARDAINSVGPCTKCASDRFFSRRANGRQITGLQASFIGLKP
jgi:polyphenol oxidase